MDQQRHIANKTGRLLLSALLAVGCIIPMQANAMPGAAHDRLGGRLAETAGRRGASSLSEYGVAQVSRYMDAPSANLGSWHGSLRHNPRVVATKLSQSMGIPYRDALNMARLHKIADVAHNTRPVDGWSITPKMKRQAASILRHVEKKGKLPAGLPRWVDSSGPGLTGKSTGKVAAKSIPGLAGGASFAGGYFLISGGIDTAQVIRGATNPNDLSTQLAHNAVKAAGAGALYTAVGVVALSNPGTATLFIVAAGSVIVVETTYAQLRPYLERETLAYGAYNSNLPGSMRGASPADRIVEQTPGEGFRTAYGPIAHAESNGSLHGRWNREAKQ